MYFNQKIKDNLLVSILFLILLIIGLKSFQDYGISLDENFHRESGQLYYGYLKEVLFQSSSNNYSATEMRQLTQGSVLFKMPAIFDVFNEFLIDFFSVKDSQTVFYLRHFVNFAIFLVGCFYFFLIIIKVTNKKFYGLLGLSFLFFYPRIFGESFYNNKDLIFLSVSIILLYYSLQFLDKLTLKNSILFGLISALAFDIRIMALLIIFSTYSILFLKIMDNKNHFKNNYRYILIALIFNITFIFIFWPYLWFDPINNLIDFFKIIKGATPGILNHYMGEYIYSKSTPWHYDFVWILITIPFSVTIFFLIGISKVFLDLKKMVLKIENKDHKFLKSNNELYNYFFFLIFSTVLFAQIKFGVSYDAWRHLYFLYPIIIIFFLQGLSYVTLILSNKKFLKILYLAVFCELFYLITWSVRHHPHQYVFFNPLYKKFTLNKFELDYWGLSNRSALEFILKDSKKENIKVAAISWTSLENSLLIMNKNQRKRIEIIYDVKRADYVIDNYRKKKVRSPYKKIINNEFEKIHDLIIDKQIINSIFKKKN